MEKFFRRRSDDLDSVKVVDHQLITGGYSRQMSRVWVEEGGQRRGYIVRQDPPPGEAIIETDRAGNYFLKFVGPGATVAENEKAFARMVEELQWGE